MPNAIISAKSNHLPMQNTIIPESPIRLYAGTKKLIGKTITDDIIGYNSEIIAHKNQKINQKIINKAISHNKLNLLNFYSK